MARHLYETTRSSPFGKYATCSCGWVSPGYSDTHEAAWQTWVEHKADVDGTSGRDDTAPATVEGVQISCRECGADYVAERTETGRLLAVKCPNGHFRASWD